MEECFGSKALETKVAQGDILLSEAQMAALKKAKGDKEAHASLRASTPDLLRAQDTFHGSRVSL
jgi:hypothetical protein